MKKDKNCDYTIKNNVNNKLTLCGGYGESDTKSISTDKAEKIIELTEKYLKI